MQSNSVPQHPAPFAPNSMQQYLITLLLCLLLGVFGVHRFYVGKIGTGVLQLVTIGGLGIWALYDLIIIAFGAFTDKDGNRITIWERS